MLVCGRYWPSVETLAELPYVHPILSARNRAELARLRQRLSSTRPVYGACVHRSLIGKDLVKKLHENAQIVMTWPINDVASLDVMLALGVTGIISDQMDVLAEILRRRRNDDTAA